MIATVNNLSSVIYFSIHIEWGTSKGLLPWQNCIPKEESFYFVVMMRGVLSGLVVRFRTFRRRIRYRMAFRFHDSCRGVGLPVDGSHLSLPYTSFLSFCLPGTSVFVSYSFFSVWKPRALLPIEEPLDHKKDKPGFLSSSRGGKCAAGIPVRRGTTWSGEYKIECRDVTHYFRCKKSSEITGGLPLVKVNAVTTRHYSRPSTGSPTGTTTTAGNRSNGSRTTSSANGRKLSASSTKGKGLNCYAQHIRILLQDVLHEASVTDTTTRSTWDGHRPHCPLPISLQKCSAFASLNCLFQALLAPSLEEIHLAASTVVTPSTRTVNEGKGPVPPYEPLHPLLCIRLLSFLGPCVWWSHPSVRFGLPYTHHQDSRTPTALTPPPHCSRHVSRSEEMTGGWGAECWFPLYLLPAPSFACSSSMCDGASPFRLDDRAVVIMTRILLPLLSGDLLGKVQFSDVTEGRDEHTLEKNRESPTKASICWSPAYIASFLSSSFTSSTTTGSPFAAEFFPPPCTLLSSRVPPHPQVAPHLPVIWEWLWALDRHFDSFEKNIRKRRRQQQQREEASARNGRVGEMLDYSPSPPLVSSAVQEEGKGRRISLAALPGPLQRSHWLALYLYFLQEQSPMLSSSLQPSFCSDVDASSPPPPPPTLPLNVAASKNAPPSFPPLRHVVPLVLAEEVLPALQLLQGSPVASHITETIPPGSYRNDETTTEPLSSAGKGGEEALLANAFPHLPLPTASPKVNTKITPPTSLPSSSWTPRTPREEGLVQFIHHALYVWWWTETRDGTPPPSTTTTGVPCTTTTTAVEQTMLPENQKGAVDDGLGSSSESSRWWWLPIGDALWWGRIHRVPSLPLASLPMRGDQREYRIPYRATFVFHPPFHTTTPVKALHDEEEEEQMQWWEAGMEEEELHFPSSSFLFARVSSTAIQKPLLYHPILCDAVQTVARVFSVLYPFCRSSSVGVSVGNESGILHLPISIPNEACWRRLLLLLAGGPPACSVLPSYSAGATPHSEVPNEREGGGVVVVFLSPQLLRYTLSARRGGMLHSNMAHPDNHHEMGKQDIADEKNKNKPHELERSTPALSCSTERPCVMEAIPQETPTSEKTTRSDGVGRSNARRACGSMSPKKAPTSTAPPHPRCHISSTQGEERDASVSSWCVQGDTVETKNFEERRASDSPEEEGTHASTPAQGQTLLTIIKRDFHCLGFIIPLRHFFQTMTEIAEEAAQEDEKERSRVSPSSSLRGSFPSTQGGRTGTLRMTNGGVQLSPLAIVQWIGEMIKDVHHLREEGWKYAPVARFYEDISSPQDHKGNEWNREEDISAMPRKRSVGDASVSLGRIKGTDGGGGPTSSSCVSLTEIYPPEAFTLLPHSPRVHALKYITDVIYSQLAPPPPSTLVGEARQWHRPPRSHDISFSAVGRITQKENEDMKKEKKNQRSETEEENEAGNEMVKKEETPTYSEPHGIANEKTEETTRNGGVREGEHTKGSCPPSSASDFLAALSKDTMSSSVATPLSVTGDGLSLASVVWRYRGKARAFVRALMEEKRVSISQERLRHRAGTLVPIEEEEEDKGEGWKPIDSHKSDGMEPLDESPKVEEEEDALGHSRHHRTPAGIYLPGQSGGGGAAGGYRSVLEAGGISSSWKKEVDVYSERRGREEGGKKPPVHERAVTLERRKGKELEEGVCAAVDTLRNAAFRLVEPAIGRWYDLQDRWERQGMAVIPRHAMNLLLPRQANTTETRKTVAAVEKGVGRSVGLPSSSRCGVGSGDSGHSFSLLCRWLWSAPTGCGATRVSPSTLHASWCALVEAQTTIVDVLGLPPEEALCRPPLEGEGRGRTMVGAGCFSEGGGILDPPQGGKAILRDMQSFLALPLSDSLVKVLEGIRLAGLLSWWNTSRQWRAWNITEWEWQGDEHFSSLSTSSAGDEVTSLAGCSFSFLNGPSAIRTTANTSSQRIDGGGNAQEGSVVRPFSSCTEVVHPTLALDRVANAALCVWHRCQSQSWEEEEETRSGSRRRRMGIDTLHGAHSGAAVCVLPLSGTVRRDSCVVPSFAVKAMVLSLLLYRTHVLHESVRGRCIAYGGGLSHSSHLARTVVESSSFRSLIQAIAAIPPPLPPRMLRQPKEKQQKKSSSSRGGMPLFYKEGSASDAEESFISPTLGVPPSSSSHGLLRTFDVLCSFTAEWHVLGIEPLLYAVSHRLQHPCGLHQHYEESAHSCLHDRLSKRDTSSEDLNKEKEDEGEKGVEKGAYSSKTKREGRHRVLPKKRSHPAMHVYYPPMGSQRPSSLFLFSSFNRRSSSSSFLSPSTGSGGGGLDAFQEFVQSFRDIHRTILRESKEADENGRSEEAKGKEEEEEEINTVQCIWLGTPASILAAAEICREWKRRFPLHFQEEDEPEDDVMSSRKNRSREEQVWRRKEGVLTPTPLVLIFALPWSTLAERLSPLRLYDEGGASEKRQDAVDLSLQQLLEMTTSKTNTEGFCIPLTQWTENEGEKKRDGLDKVEGKEKEQPSCIEMTLPIVKFARVVAGIRLISLKEEMLHILPAGPWKALSSIARIKEKKEGKTENEKPTALCDTPGCFPSTNDSPNHTSECTASTSSASVTTPPSLTASSMYPLNSFVLSSDTLPSPLRRLPTVMSDNFTTSHLTFTLKEADTPQVSSPGSRTGNMDPQKGNTSLSLSSSTTNQHHRSSPPFVLPLSPSLQFISIGYPTKVEECASTSTCA